MRPEREAPSGSFCSESRARRLRPTRRPKRTSNHTPCPRRLFATKQDGLHGDPRPVFRVRGVLSPVRKNAKSFPVRSQAAWIFVDRPPTERPRASLLCEPAADCLSFSAASPRPPWARPSRSSSRCCTRRGRRPASRAKMKASRRLPFGKARRSVCGRPGNGRIRPAGRAKGPPWPRSRTRHGRTFGCPKARPFGPQAFKNRGSKRVQSSSERPVADRHSRSEIPMGPRFRRSGNWFTDPKNLGSFQLAFASVAPAASCSGGGTCLDISAFARSIQLLLQSPVSGCCPIRSRPEWRQVEVEVQNQF